jgi:hypothetical protein
MRARAFNNFQRNNLHTSRNCSRLLRSVSGGPSRGRLARIRFSRARKPEPVGRVSFALTARPSVLFYAVLRNRTINTSPWRYINMNYYQHFVLRFLEYKFVTWADCDLIRGHRTWTWTCCISLAHPSGSTACACSRDKHFVDNFTVSDVCPNFPVRLFAVHFLYH